MPATTDLTRALTCSLLFVISCGDPPAEDDGGPSACISGEFCVGALVCVDGFCVEPSGTESSGDGDGDTSDGDGDGDAGDGDGDDGDDCPDGTIGCECLPNSQCDEGLSCVDDVCMSQSCGNGVVEPGEECDDENAFNDDDCLDNCVAATCGDGFLHLGVEQCDDQNDLNDDDCLVTCMAATCGDGFIHTDVEECDDGNASNDDACLVNCDAATCGDGIVHVGVEDCDDENADDTDACISTCEAAECGDGFVHEGVETCDDGNGVANDVCNNLCEWGAATNRVFVTSVLYDGNLGGLAGADAKCQARAAAAGHPGTYKAWLSTDVNNSPATRFTQSPNPYVLVNGTKIADNWADLTDETLDNPIDIDEWGAPSPESNLINCSGTTRVAFTASFATGLQNGSDCSDWTSSASILSAVGNTTLSSSQWSLACNGQWCDEFAALYCFEQ